MANETPWMRPEDFTKLFADMKLPALPNMEELAATQRRGLETLQKMFGDLKLPAMPAMPDIQGVLDAQKRNLEAFTQANRIALEGAQAVTRRHMEIAQQSFAELPEMMRSLAATDAPKDKVVQQIAVLRAAYEKAAANAHELAELIQRSNSEAVGLLEKRVSEALAEAQALAEKAAALKG